MRSLTSFRLRNQRAILAFIAKKRNIDPTAADTATKNPKAASPRRNIARCDSSGCISGNQRKWLGEIEDVDWYGNKFDTALSQLIEAQANRECDQAIIVFDKSSVAPALLNKIGNIAFRPKYGFIVIVDSLRGDYQNLGLAYLLARDLAAVMRWNRHPRCSRTS